MACPVSITIHSSQFPGNVQRDLLNSLRSRQVNHKFHYDSFKQTQKWLALHQAYSPSRTDPNCTQVYDQSFAATAARVQGGRVHLIGLGCGGGQKDVRLLKLLKGQGRGLFYTPSDVSVAMVLVAQQAATSVIAPTRCSPFVCDLASPDKIAFPNPAGGKAERLLTFFGMIPNFEPQIILPRLAGLARRNDYLLFSANLAPGKNYSEGVQKILPLYDNDLTRDWLQAFLVDLGVEGNSGILKFTVETGKSRPHLKRVAVDYLFMQPTRIELPDESFEFRKGDKIRLFFSYRYTPPRLITLLKEHGIDVLNQWITESEEEGVFLCRKSR